jgi:2-hydroxychromene-2-carboxylate isomerase
MADPMLTIESYTIYHSPNAYLGSVLLRRALADLPGVRLVRRPFLIPRARGVLVADLVGSHEPPVKNAYHREDCARWSRRFDIPLHHPPRALFEERRQRWAGSRWEREELPARAYYAAVGSGREDALDAKLFEAAWVAGLDVNEPDAIRWAAGEAGLDGERLLAALEADDFAAQPRQALADFERHGCPGVPTFVLDGERFFGKDRVDWLVQACRDHGPSPRPSSTLPVDRGEGDPQF